MRRAFDSRDLLITARLGFVGRRIRHRGLGQSRFSTAAKIAKGLYTASGGTGLWVRSLGSLGSDSGRSAISAALSPRSRRPKLLNAEFAENCRRGRQEDRLGSTVLWHG